MRFIKLKTSNEMNLNSSFLEYISNSYGQQAVTPKLQNYFSEFNQNRNHIAHISIDQNSIKDLENSIQITTKYFNQLVAIKSKMISNGLNIDFAWTDTIGENVCSSSNIFFEYYNVLFNLAALYFYLGYNKSNSPKIDKELRKEAIKDFKYSLYLFNIIRDQALNQIEQSQLPCDLSPIYCEYLSTLCIIFGQIEIVKIAEETNPNEFALRCKLLKGISDNFNKAYLLSNGESIKNGISDSFQNYLINRHIYYKSLTYKKLSESHMKKFNDKGLGYGEALVYQQLSMQELVECQKTINYCEGLINIEEFNTYFNNEKQLEEKMKDLNYRIYHQYTPDPNTIKLEARVLMVPLPIDNIYIGENESKYINNKTINCEDLELLTPNEIKSMLDNYKNQMNYFIQDYLKRYETEKTIQKYIDTLNLPQKLTYKPFDSKNPNSSGMPENLWEKINDIQQLGGIIYLNNTMKKILNKSSDFIDNLNLMLSEIVKEENEDNYYRNKLGNKWDISPSKNFNINYIEKIKNYQSKINKAREEDFKDENDLYEKTQNYEDLNLTKNQFEQKINQLSRTNVEMTEEEKNLRFEIVKLYSLGDKSFNITNPIFKAIQSGSGVIPYFSKVLSNQMNEQSVFEMAKEKYLKQLEPLEALSNEIKSQKIKVNDLIPTISENSIFPRGNDDDKVSIFFENLEKTVNDFLEKKEKLNNRENYYLEFEDNINDLIRTVKEWLEQRKEEKKTLLGKVGGNIPKFNPNSVVNPFDNVNNNESYYINEINNNDNYNPYDNINQNQNQNSNFNQNQNYPNFDQNINQNYQNFNQNQNQKIHSKLNFNNNDQYYNKQNFNLNQDLNSNLNQNNNKNYEQHPYQSQNQIYQNQNLNNSQNLPQNNNYYYGNSNLQNNNNYNQNLDKNNEDLSLGYSHSGGINYDNINSQPQHFNQNNQFKEFYNQETGVYNDNSINNNNNPSSFDKNISFGNINNPPPGFDKSNNFGNNYNPPHDFDKSNSYGNNYNPPPGFDKRNSFGNNYNPPPDFDQIKSINQSNCDDHFNPNKPQKINNSNNFNVNMGNPFGQNNNCNGPSYNNRTPYNK